MPSQCDVPYIWVTWLASLLSGDNHCEWAAWFRASFHHLRRPSSFGEVRFRSDHGEMVRARVSELQKLGYQVFIEDQNNFNLKGRAATLGGTADIVAIGEQEAWVIDSKSSRQGALDQGAQSGGMPLVSGVAGRLPGTNGRTCAGRHAGA